MPDRPISISFYDLPAMVRFMRAVWETADELQAMGLTEQATELRRAYIDFEQEAVNGPPANKDNA